MDVDEAQKWDSRGHFFAAAAEAMRRILVDNARRRDSLKRGGALERVELPDVAVPDIEPQLDLLALDDALRELELVQPNKARLVKLRFFSSRSERSGGTPSALSKLKHLQVYHRDAKFEYVGVMATGQADGCNRCYGRGEWTVMTSPPENARPQRKRRWPRFGLATLLGVVTLSAIVVALIVNPAERHRRAVEAVRSLGGVVVVANEGPVRSWLRDQLGTDYFGHAVEVFLAETINDADLRHLEELTELRKLHLNYSQVGDEGLRHLRGLTHLTVLNLDNTRITDAGLTNLTTLSSLEDLDLCNTQVTDAGLEHLKVLTGLKHLAVLNTRVSSAGAAEWGRHVPGCRMTRAMDTVETIVSPDDR